MIKKASSVKSERGASLVEYVLLATLIAVVALTAVQFFGQSVSGKFSAIVEELPD